MKRRLFLLQIFLILIIIFSSCTAESDDAALITEHMREIPSANYLVHITANFPEREVNFTLNYSYSKDGDDRATVISPEDIAGIALTISGDTPHLEFDGARLEMGTLDKNGLTPISSVPSLITVWTGGSFSEISDTRIYGRDAHLMIYRASDGDGSLEYRTWFSKDESMPLYAEIFADGERVIQCEFERAE